MIYKQTNQIQSEEFKLKRPNLILKLHNNNDTFYTMTNDKGIYSFSEVKPGNWEVRIITKGLEKKFDFPKKVKHLKLVSGENVTVNFLMKVISRKINISKKKFKLKTD